MTDTLLVVRKLAVLREHVARARRRRSPSLDRLWNELPARLDALDRYAATIAAWMQPPPAA